MLERRLTKEEAYELIFKAQNGCKKSSEDLYYAHEGLIKSIVKEFSKGLDEDVLQVGCEGFVKAIRDFKFDYDCSFSTFAYPKIRGEILRFFRGGHNSVNSLKYSRSVVEIAGKAMRVSKEQGISYFEAIAEFDTEGKLTNELVQFVSRHTYLNCPAVTDNEKTLYYEDIIGQCDDEIWYRLYKNDFLNQLDSREVAIFDLLHVEGAGQVETGRKLKLSQTQISRISKRIKDKLISYLEEVEEIEPIQASR